MSTTFSRSMRSLAADGARRSAWGLLSALVLLAAWAAWLFLARVEVYEVTDTARLEVERQVHPVGAPVAGRVVATHLVLDQEVKAGAVLVELDAEAQRLQLAEERARQAGLAAQLAALHDEVKAQEEAQRLERKAAAVGLDEARARHREEEVGAHFAEQEVERLTRLQTAGQISEVEFMRAKAEAQKHRAAEETLRLAVGRLESEQGASDEGRHAHLAQLQREVALLEGQQATGAATIERLGSEIERRCVRAPVAGRLGEVGDLQVGTVVEAGAKLCAVVPPGELKVIAEFPPPAALGRVRPGQEARLRLDGFPWTQYGSVAARVARVATEARNGRVRVELTVTPDPASRIPLQHGLPGTIEVRVERVAPATLVLRAAGQLLAAPGSAAGAPAGGRKADE